MSSCWSQLCIASCNKHDDRIASKLEKCCCHPIIYFFFWRKKSYIQHNWLLCCPTSGGTGTLFFGVHYHGCLFVCNVYLLLLVVGSFLFVEGWKKFNTTVTVCFIFLDVWGNKLLSVPVSPKFEPRGYWSFSVMNVLCERENVPEVFSLCKHTKY